MVTSPDGLDIYGIPNVHIAKKVPTLRLLDKCAELQLK